MLVTLLIRVAVTLTFLILALGGPYAIILLRRFIKHYTVAHEALKERVRFLERQLGITSPDEEQH